MVAWMVCHVWRGFIQEPELFFTQEEAVDRKRALEQDCNTDYDEIKVFEKRIEPSVPVTAATRA